MKRNENILPLSREHHFGLLFCWKIRQALQKEVDIVRILPYIRYFLQNHLLPHFHSEETILFKYEDELCQQAIAEHAAIKDLADAILNGKNKSLQELIDLLDRHIRFEERVLFPHLEKSILPEALKEIGMQLQELEKEQPKDHYPDEFWT